MELELPHAIQQTILNGIGAFEAVTSHKKFVYKTIPIDCADLPDPRWSEKMFYPDELSHLRSELPEKKNPCLYYFMIMNENAESVLASYKKHMREGDYKQRNSATLKKQPPLNSRVLYVGKVKSDMSGRMFIHLGYYYVERTAGLQLVCWAKELKLKLMLHMYIFEPEMSAFVSSLELPFARSLNPIIGKH